MISTEVTSGDNAGVYRVSGIGMYVLYVIV